MCSNDFFILFDFNFNDTFIVFSNRNCTNLHHYNEVLHHCLQKQIPKLLKTLVDSKYSADKSRTKRIF